MLLETTNLRKKFGEVVAMDGLDFTLDKGEVRAIIGPNGAGKTTFFNLLTGALPVDDGQIKFKGDNITNEKIDMIAQMGMIRKFQTPSVYEELTIEEHFNIATNPSRMSDTKTRKGWALEKVGLENRVDEKAGSLDHGNKQWLEIGMILAADPDLLLLDEPTAGMTVEETNKTTKLIRHLNEKEDISVITIEHDLQFVRDLGASITVLHQGKNVAEGSIDQIESDPYVKQIYIGED